MFRLAFGRLRSLHASGRPLALGLSAVASGAVLSAVLQPPGFIMTQESKQPTGAMPGQKFKPLNVLIIRHGESESNVMLDPKLEEGLLKDEMFTSKLKEVFKGSTEAFDDLLLNMTEPALTSLGFAQAERLSGYAAPLADSVGKDGKVCMFVSPQLRTCQTAHPLFLALKAKNFVTAEVKEDIFEMPGILKLKLPPLGDASLSFVDKFRILQNVWTSVIDEQSEGYGQNERHMREVFGYDTSKMKNRSEQGWCSLKQFETDEDVNSRAQGVIDWLLSERLYQHCADQAPNGHPWVVLVAHGKFNTMLIQKLLGSERSFAHANTNVTHFSIQHKVGKPSHLTLCSMNQVEHLWTLPHGFGSAPPLPLNYHEGKSGAWNNYGRT